MLLRRAILRTKMTSGPLVTPAPPATPADPAADGDRRLISVVSPCYNEAAVIDLFYVELCRVIEGLPEYDFELILVDDGSADRTLEALNRLAGQDGRVRAQRQLHLRTVLPQEGMLPGYAASPRTILTREACLRV